NPAVSGPVWQKQIGDDVVGQVLSSKAGAIKETHKITNQPLVSSLKCFPCNPGALGQCSQWLLAVYSRAALRASSRQVQVPPMKGFYKAHGVGRQWRFAQVFVENGIDSVRIGGQRQTEISKPRLPF